MFLVTLSFLLFFCGCALNPKNPVVESSAEVETSQNEKEQNSPVILDSHQKLKPKSYAVWIDSNGFDALLALGVLQNWERKGLKLQKIAGTGFGCWVALSWAMKGSGNFAEWQTFKWQNFSDIRSKTFLGINNPWNKLESDTEKHLGKKHPRDFSVLVDCPILPSKAPYILQSGRFLETGQLIAFQLMNPHLGASFEEIKNKVWMTGALAGVPTPSEIRDFSRDLTSKENEDSPFGGWIVLSTRAPWELSSKRSEELLEIVSFRNEQRTQESPGRVSQDLPAANQVAHFKFIDLRSASQIGKGKFNKPSVDDSDLRRAWLLEGQRLGEVFWKPLENEGFFFPISADAPRHKN
jgi:hypothetical protein